MHLLISTNWIFMENHPGSTISQFVGKFEVLAIDSENTLQQTVHSDLKTSFKIIEAKTIKQA